jgi:hypothetical protein
LAQKQRREILSTLYRADFLSRLVAVPSIRRGRTGASSSRSPSQPPAPAASEGLATPNASAIHHDKNGGGHGARKNGGNNQGDSNPCATAAGKRAIASAAHPAARANGCCPNCTGTSAPDSSYRSVAS